MTLADLPGTRVHTMDGREGIIEDIDSELTSVVAIDGGEVETICNDSLAIEDGSMGGGEMIASLLEEL